MVDSGYVRRYGVTVLQKKTMCHQEHLEYHKYSDLFQISSTE